MPIMDTQIALKMAAHSAELTQLSTIFQVKFGRRYAFTPESPAEAQLMHQALCAKQTAIARLLDPAALASPIKRAGEWWRYDQAMPEATAGELAREVNHLIACCAYCEANGSGLESSRAVFNAQATIAGLLHPSVRAVTEAQPALLDLSRVTADR